MTSASFGRSRFDYFLKPRVRAGSKGALAQEVAARVESTLVQAYCEPPRINLTRFGEHLGVVSIKYVPLAKRGRLLRVPGGYAVEVDQALNTDDQRFVLAHELAHILIEGSSFAISSPGLGRTRNQGSLPYRLLEEMCDFGACEILLPTAFLRARLRGVDLDLTTVFEIAGEAQCAVKLVAKRICELELWQCRFIWWQRRNDNAVAIDSIPAIAEESLPVLLDDKAHVIDRALSGVGAARGVARMSFLGREDEYRVHAAAIDINSALMLIDHGA